MIIRKASEGKWLYNGKTCTDSIFAPDDYNPNDWWEVDEYIEPIDDDITAEEALAIITGGASDD